MQTIQIGSNIEALVCAFLESSGLKYVQKNYRCRLGEIDLVMHDKASDSLVFVEVRYRASAQFGSATETVTTTKQRKLKRAVLHYLQKHCNAHQRVRIDVVGVCLKSKTSESEATKTRQSNKSDSNLAAASQTHAATSYDFDGYQLHWTRNAIEE